MADPFTHFALPCFQLVAATVNACLTPVNEVLKETLTACIYLDKNLSSLGDSLRQLQALAEKLKANVEEEEAQMRVCNPDVREWQKKVGEVVIRAEPLLAKDYPTDGSSQPSTADAGPSSKTTLQRLLNEWTAFPLPNVRRLPPRLSASTCTCCKATLFPRFRFSRKVIRALYDVNGLLIEGSLFTPPFTSPPPPEAVLLMPTLKPAFGIDAVMHQVWLQFNNKHTSVIGLYGPGGVGKTTILKLFNNELRQRKDGYQFQVVIMLEVANAKTLNVAGMQRIISNRLGVPWNKDESDADRAAFLLQVLIKKKFVVLLDDVWNKFELEHVGIPTPLHGNGSKLIVASRGESVCINMGAKSPIKVHCMQEDEAWRLFLSKLTKNVRANVLAKEDVKQCAMEIVKSCDGLPLAIDVISSTLTASLGLESWKKIAAAMWKNPSSTEGVDHMMTVLQYSYDRLEDKEKKCFIYCTMFPEYGSIRHEQLVDYWVAEGLISPDAYEGHRIIKKLLSACLLQRSDMDPTSEVKMHQMIRIMGRQQASENKLLIKAGQAVEQELDAKEWEEAMRISLMYNDIRKLSISPNSKRLLTLLLQNNPNLHQLNPKFFYSMSALKVLDLSHTAISVLPDCSKLIQLVYLNLSHTPIREVPKQFCSALVKLQYLNMSHTLITSLPQQLAKLEKLTYLNLCETLALTVIPHGTISRLFKLKVLNLYKSNYGVKDLPDLNLEGLGQLTYLGITIYSQQAFSKLRKSDPLARCTRLLSLSHCPGMKSIQLSEFKTMMHLMELHIETCEDLEELIVDCDDGSDSVKRVMVLTLTDLPNLTKVSCGSAMHRFQDLRVLNICECPKLQNLSWVVQLESLERLIITDCHGLEQVVQEEMKPMHKRDLNEATPVAGGRNLLPKLRILELKHLSKLESIGRNVEFPCLESITVDQCPNLTMVPELSMYPELKQICGEENWWEMIASEVDTDFINLFVPI